MLCGSENLFCDQCKDHHKSSLWYACDPHFEFSYS
jgi:hypothetical protein